MDSCYTPSDIIRYFFHSVPECRELLESKDLVPEIGLLTYLQAYGWTYALEAPIYLAVGRHLKRSWGGLFFQVFALNLATHPIVTFVIPRLLVRFGTPFYAYISVAELFAPVVEALLLRYWARYPWKWALLASCFANLISWWIGTYVPIV